MVQYPHGGSSRELSTAIELAQHKRGKLAIEKTAVAWNGLEGETLGGIQDDNTGARGVVAMVNMKMVKIGLAGLTVTEKNPLGHGAASRPTSRRITALQRAILRMSV
jgi:hypothetical protein